MTGKTYGSWTVMAYVGRSGKANRTHWMCQCICGSRQKVCSANLVSGQSRSCGCRAKLSVSQAKTIHGCARNELTTVEYNCYSSIKRRITNPKHPQYKNYGGRGIKMCSRWLEDFRNFLADMGARPSSLCSLDRIDNDGDYSPENCRWTTSKDQARNRSNNVKVTINGDTKCVAEWCDHFGIRVTPTVYDRLKRGWSPEESFTIPIGHKRPKHQTPRKI